MMRHPSNLRFPMPAALANPVASWSADPTLDDHQDVEELALLLHASEMHELADAAQQEGLTAAGLARYLIREYLLWTRSDLGKVLARSHRRPVSGGTR